MGSITVSTAAELSKAISTAASGDTIVLKAGNYGSLTIGNYVTGYSTAIKLVSEDPSNPATITSLNLAKASNIQIDSIKFDFTSKFGAPDYTPCVDINQSKNISITNSIFDGDVAKGLSATENGYGTGTGVIFNNSSNITVTNNKFSNFLNGGSFLASSDILVSGNEFTKMAKDGLQFAQVQRVDVLNNSLHDFLRNPLSTVHPDMIQFWTQGATAPNTDIRISGNYLDSGNGGFTQSIFMRNEAVDSAGAGTNMYYRNVEISNNVIRNGHVHGVTVGEGTGIKITNNTILPNVFGDLDSVPSILVASASSNVTISQNITSKLIFTPNAAWNVSNNLIIQTNNPAADNYVGRVFTDPFDHTTSSLSDFVFQPTSIYASAGIGANLPASAANNGQILNSDVAGHNTLDQKFDASSILAAGSSINLTGASVSWNFGDGSTGSGATASHAYAGPGVYSASVSVTLASGQKIETNKTIVVKDSEILNLNFTNGVGDATHTPNQAVIIGNQPHITTLANGNKVLDLSGGAVAVSTDPSFFNNTEYSYVSDFKKNPAATNEIGRIAYFNGGLVVSVRPDGVEAIVTTSFGEKTIRVDGLGLNDTDWHRIGVTYSSELGLAKLFLDGKEIGSITGLQGSFQTADRGTEFYIGGQFGSNFNGQIDNVHFIGDALPMYKLMTLDSHPSSGTFSPEFDALVAQAAANPVIEPPVVVTPPPPAPAPEPSPAPQPAPQPEPAPAPQPVPQPEPAPAPKPVPQPEPAPAPKPTPEALPEPMPAPTVEQPPVFDDPHPVIKIPGTHTNAFWHPVLLLDDFRLF